MQKKLKMVFCLMVGAILVAASIVPVHAQQLPTISRPLGLRAPVGLPVIPIFEGAYENEDGSVTYSFGYLNRNTGEALEVPLGSNNRIEPAEYSGMQPARFETRRHTGVFTITVPDSMRDGEVWWHIKTGEHEELKVKGRRGALGYTLDKKPRPAGSVAPLVAFSPDGPKGQDPMGLVSAEALTVKAGSPATLTVYVEDPSVRDMTDPRNIEGIPVRVSWYKHQGEGQVTWERHSTSEPPPVLSEQQIARGAQQAGPDETELSSGNGVASVIATFSQPGEYMIRTMADNWDATDSTEGDQCCWTNVFQRVTVIP
jgi:hypothetical protein